MEEIQKMNLCRLCKNKYLQKTKYIYILNTQISKCSIFEDIKTKYKLKIKRDEDSNMSKIIECNFYELDWVK